MAQAKSSYASALMTVFGRNWLTLSGGVFAGVSAALFVVFMALGMLQVINSPYLGILTFLVLPVVFVGGLLLVPVGIYLGKDTFSQGTPFPVIDFNCLHTRRVGLLVTVFTMFNLLLVGSATFAGVHFMDSVTFCGEVCHTVMEPQHTAYLKSPHQRVACVECHIGPGADWFVKSKLSGVRQIFAVAFGTYPEPIPSPVENLRPSRDTCEQCHWPEKFTGDHLRVITHFEEDETNTALKTILLMHIGGGEDSRAGIHSAHINSDMQVYYTPADAKRQVMSQVRVVRKGGEETVYRMNEGEVQHEGEDRLHEERMMDCIDCHNRPSHIFKLPEEELDAALNDGRIDVALPFIKKEGVEALKAAAEDSDGIASIETHVRTFYTERYPDLAASEGQKIEAAITELQAVYKANIFPKMGVTWNTYPLNIGHETAPGCFRCHNDSLVTPAGKTIGQDCTTCHTVLAWDEENPAVLEELGI